MIIKRIISFVCVLSLTAPIFAAEPLAKTQIGFNTGLQNATKAIESGEFAEAERIIKELRRIQPNNKAITSLVNSLNAKKALAERGAAPGGGERAAEEAEQRAAQEAARLKRETDRAQAALQEEIRLLKLAGARGPIDKPELEAQIAQLEARTRELRKFIDEGIVENDRLNKDIESLKTKCEQENTASQAQIKSHLAKITAKDAQIAQLEAQSKGAPVNQTELNKAKAERDQANQKLLAAQQQLSLATQQVAENKKATNAANQIAETCTAQVKSQKQEVEKAKQEVEKVTQLTQVYVQENAASKAKITAQDTKIAQLQEQCKEAANPQALFEARKELDQAKLKLAEEQHALARTREQASQDKKALEQVRKERDALRIDHGTATMELAAIQKELADTRTQAAQQKKALEQAVKEANDAAREEITRLKAQRSRAVTFLNSLINTPTTDAGIKQQANELHDEMLK